MTPHVSLCFGNGYSKYIPVCEFSNGQIGKGLAGHIKKLRLHGKGDGELLMALVL